jgi:hypothetical protein
LLLLFSPSLPFLPCNPSESDEKLVSYDQRLTSLQMELSSAKAQARTFEMEAQDARKEAASLKMRGAAHPVQLGSDDEDSFEDA